MDVVIASVVFLVGVWVLAHLLFKRLDVIHDLVNSNLTKARADLKTALKRIDTLEEILTKTAVGPDHQERE